MSGKKIVNFAAGPAKVPEEVLVQAQKELIHYQDCGISVMGKNDNFRFRSTEFTQ